MLHTFLCMPTYDQHFLLSKMIATEQVSSCLLFFRFRQRGDGDTKVIVYNRKRTFTSGVCPAHYFSFLASFIGRY